MSRDFPCILVGISFKSMSFRKLSEIFKVPCPMGYFSRIICFMFFFLLFFLLRFISSSFVCSVVLLSWPYVGVRVWVGIWMFGWFFRKRWNGWTHQFLSQNAIAYLFFLRLNINSHQKDNCRYIQDVYIGSIVQHILTNSYEMKEWTKQTQTPTSSSAAAAHIAECHIVMCASFTRTRQVRFFGTRNCKKMSSQWLLPHRERSLQTNNVQFSFHTPFFMRKLHVALVNMIIWNDH